MAPIQGFYIRLGMRTFSLCMGQKRERPPLPLFLCSILKNSETLSHVSRPHTGNGSPEPPPSQHGRVSLCSSGRLTLGAALQNISFRQSPEATRADQRRQVSVTEQRLSPAHFIKQNVHFGPSFSPVALWETYQSVVPLIQSDTDCTAAADICTFADFSMSRLQKQTSVKWRCKIFIDIYKLEGNKKNFRPDTL